MTLDNWPRGPADDSVERFAQDLKLLREAADLSQRAVGRAGHVSHDRIYVAELGKQVPTVTVTVAYIKGIGGTAEDISRWRERCEQLRRHPKPGPDVPAASAPKDEPVTGATLRHGPSLRSELRDETHHETARPSVGSAHLSVRGRPARQTRSRRAAIRRLVVGAVLLAIVGTTTFAVVGDRRQPTVAEPPPLVPETLPASAALGLSEAIVVLEAGQQNHDLYLVDVAGKTIQRRLTDDPASDRAPSISPDRRTITYLRVTEDGTSTLRVMAADGHGDRPLFPEPVEGCPDMGRPSWSPADPEVLVIACKDGDERSLHLITVNGQVLRTFDLKDVIPFDPTFSPDGTTILYSGSDVAAPTGGSLYTVAANGDSDPVQLTDAGLGGDLGPTWSPTGAQIAFRRRVDNDTPAGNSEIYVINTDGTDPRVLAAHPAQDTGPAWSPDGTQIMFMSERKSPAAFDVSHLWIVNADGSNLQQLLREAGGEFGYPPAWATR